MKRTIKSLLGIDVVKDTDPWTRSSEELRSDATNNRIMGIGRITGGIAMWAAMFTADMAASEHKGLNDFTDLALVAGNIALYIGGIKLAGHGYIDVQISRDYEHNADRIDYLGVSCGNELLTKSPKQLDQQR